MDPSTTDLLQRSRSNDQEAFGLLVDRHKGLVVNYLTRLTGSRDRAEEIAQETFVRLYQKLDVYRHEGALSAFLLRIATNLVRSEERRKKRWRNLRPVLVASEFLPFSRVVDSSRQGDQEGMLLASEEQRMVARALASLDLLYRAPLVLREIEGCSYQEIAEALDCQEGTVKSRLHRGRQLLKERLAPYWNGGN